MEPFPLTIWLAQFALLKDEDGGVVVAGEQTPPSRERWMKASMLGKVRIVPNNILLIP